MCNKVGGIYTVLSTKSGTLQKLYKDKVVFVGPDVWSEENPSPYFKETPSLLKGWGKTAELPYGIKVRVGRWLVPGRPIAVLVKFDGLYDVKNEFYARMWDLFKVDSLHAYGDYDEACAFSHAAGIVIENIISFLKLKGKRVIAHFDEWTTGMGLLYVKEKLPEVATVFTTHATSIGRSICGNGKPLYDQLRNYNGDQMASELNMEAKHSLEKTAAHQADCFTTVSAITAIECEQLLERRPDIVTPNGFEKDFVPAKTKFAAARRQARAKLTAVAEALLGKPMSENGVEPFLLATSGRCEYRNKGIDLYLDTLETLRRENPSRPIVAYVLVPAWSKEPRAELRERLDGKTAADTPLDSPWTTHWINNPGEDPIYRRIGMSPLGAETTAGNLHVIYTPCYLNGTDGIFDTPYYNLLIGFDATAFPSYYEPWGYTPLESIAFGVPTITTSLSGFGQWILDNFDNQFSSCGVNVIDRNDSNYAAVVSSMAGSLRFLMDSEDEELEQISASAIATSDQAAWSYFIKYYIEAYEKALEKVSKKKK
ncbi:MAG: glycogen/starch synthase [Clostridium sp.]|nr:glycogen/starch synthase [Clostridium sp.]